MIAQKYRLAFPKQSGLSPAVNRALATQLTNADEMFETLFTEAKRLATAIIEGGIGDVSGPAGAAGGDVAVFDGVTGKRITDGGVALASIALLPIDLATDVTGTLLAAQEPAHTGDVSNAAGSLVLTIGAGKVTNAMLAGAIAASKLIGTDLVLTESQITNLVADLAAKAPLASPALTGTPTAPTPTAGDNTTKLATTAFVTAAAAALIPISLTTQVTGTLQAAQEPAHTGDVTNSAGSLALAIGAGKVTNTMLAGSIAASKLVGTDIVIAESQVTNLTTDLAAKAPLASPALTGTPTTPTASAGTNTTQIASTAFVQGELDYVPTTNWTPTFVGGTTAGSATYTVRNATYLRFKKLVHFTVDITLSALGGAAGVAEISGLPATVGGSAQSGFDITYISGVTIPTGCTQFTAVANPGTTTIILAAVGSGTVSATVDCSAVAATATIRIHGFYFM